MHTTHTKRNGYTIFEAVLTLSILGILAGLATPKMRGAVDKGKLKGAAKQVAGDLMLAKSRATNRNNLYRVIFLNESEYMILDDRNGNGTADTTEWRQRRDLDREFAGVAFQSADNTTFYPRGDAVAADIEVLNRAGMRTIRVNSAGHIKVF